MLLFSVWGSITTLWIVVSILLIPDQLPMEKWRVPEQFRWLLTAAALLLAPIALPILAVCNWSCAMAARKRDLELQREQERLNDLVLENSRGVFDPNKLRTGSSGEARSMVNVVKQIILHAIDRGASDIFIDPKAEGGSSVRIRANGSLHPLRDLNDTDAKSVVSVIKVVAQMDISEHRMPQDGAFSARIGGVPISFRAASVGAYSGEKLSLRVLGTPAGPRTLKDLGLAPADLELLEKAVKLPSGLVLVCGPTGSGKTSTLYAMLQDIDFSLKNVISIEDPIENIIPNVSQIEVNNKAGVTFASLLRNSLRQNPDILCLGEIRDAETAEIAIQAAQTGHLILATVHSNDNIGTIDRLQNLGVPLRTIAETLHLVISQRLVRTLCPQCRQRIELPAEYREYFAAAGLRTDNVFQNVGCSACDGTGFTGRRAVFDILVIDGELRETLGGENVNLAAIQNILEQKTGGNVIAYKAFQLVAAGITTIDEVNRVTFDLG